MNNKILNIWNQHRFQTCLQLHDKLPRTFTWILRSLCLLLSFQIETYAGEYKCKHSYVIEKCSIWKEGSEIGIGGFQAAPVFTLINGIYANQTAVDHRGEKYTVVYKNGNTVFSPFQDNPYSELIIYGFDYR